MLKGIVVFGMISLISFSSFSAVGSLSTKDMLLQKYSKNYVKKGEIDALRKETLSLGGKSVEALIEVMKNGKYPEKNRWVATFLLGQIMGDKSAPFISKFLVHPNWVMRMASLKTLLVLKQNRYATQYAKMLNDESMLVRGQALENIRTLKIEKAGPQVWAMLYDKKNYYAPTINGKPLKHKRTNIIKDVIITVGDLHFEAAKEPLFKMIQKDRYNDIFPEMDLALSKLTGSKSGGSDLKTKRIYWQKAKLGSTTIL